MARASRMKEAIGKTQPHEAPKGPWLARFERPQKASHRTLDRALALRGLNREVRRAASHPKPEGKTGQRREGQDQEGGAHWITISSENASPTSG